MGAHSSGYLTIALTGTYQGVGAAGYVWTYSLSRAAAAITATQLTAQALIAGAIDVQMDVATDSGSVLIGVRMNSGVGGATALDGAVELTCLGDHRRVEALVSEIAQ